MAPPPWATEEQRVWLDTRMSRYVKLQADGKLSEFWPWVQGQWFNDFPEEAAIGLPPPSPLGDAPALTDVQMGQLGNAIKNRKSKLENWFRNQMNKQRRAAPVRTQSGESIANLLFKHKKKTRAHRAIELYQMHNKTKIDAALELAGYSAIGGPDADDNWVDESDGTRLAELKSLQSMRMRVRTRVVKALFDAEPETIRQELEEAAEKGKQERLEEVQEEGEEEESTPKSYLQSIDELADVYSKVHQATLKKAGWVTVTIIGGPNPRFNGELSMKVICAGVTAAGNDFETAHSDFEKGVSLPFQQFLRRLFPPDVRRARALDSEEPAESEDEESTAEKPKKAKRKKSKKSKCKATETPACDADGALDTLPAGDAPPSGNALLSGNAPLSGDKLIPTGGESPSDTAAALSLAAALAHVLPTVAAGGDPSTFSPFTPTINEAELLCLIALDEQDRMGDETFVGGGMDVDSVEPSWAQQFDPAMLPIPPSLPPAPSGVQPTTEPLYAAWSPAVPSGDQRMGGSPSKGQYAPPSRLFEAFSFNPPQPSNAPIMGPGIAAPGFTYPASSTAGFTFNSRPQVRASWATSSSTTGFPFDHAPPPPASSASPSTITTAAGSLTLARASAAIGSAASRRPPGPSILGKQGQDIILAVLADGQPATAAGAALTRAAAAAAGAAPAGAAPATSAGATAAGAAPASAAPATAAGAALTGAAPAGAAVAAAPVLPRPVGNLPTAFASPQKSAGRGPPMKQPGKGKAAATVAASAVGVGLEDLPVLQPTNIRRINQLADAAIAERAAKKKADRERLRNPSGGADLVVVPLPPRQRKRKELHDGTTAVMPRKRTRKEMEEEKVEALMLARREPDKVREPEKTVRAVAKTKAAGAGKKTSAGPKKRAAPTRQWEACLVSRSGGCSTTLR
ncbi:hypothetical protein C8J57DRAFT_1244120 [Mycena rebaudengoi]|nr:hypothetical protein C8J57DRAFT_1244120 [Mycena rebaudengoi]